MDKAEKISKSYDLDHNHITSYQILLDDISDHRLEQYKYMEQEGALLSEQLFDNQHHISENPYYSEKGMIEMAKNHIGKISSFCLGVSIYSLLAFMVVS